MEIPLAKLAMLGEILRTRSVSAAARSFGLSQSSASNTLARLRLAFADDLIQWVAPSPRLTAVGETLLDQIESIGAECARISHRGEFDPTTCISTFRLTASDNVAMALAPSILRRIQELAPHIRLTIEILDNQSPDPSGEGERCDMYMAWLRAPPASWYTRLLFEDRFVMIAAAGNDRVYEGMDITALLALKHIAVEPQNPHNQGFVDKELRRSGLHRDVAVWTSSSGMIPRIVGQSDLVALLPETSARMLQRNAGIKIVQSPLSLQPIRYSLMWPQRVQQDPAHRWLRDIVLKAATAFRLERR